MICAYHWRRVGKEVPMYRVVAGEPMCEGCFKGREIEGDFTRNDVEQLIGNKTKNRPSGTTLTSGRSVKRIRKELDAAFREYTIKTLWG